MKKTFLIFSLIIQLIVAGTALATPFTVDFSGVAETTGITNAPYTIGGVTFAYDDFGRGSAMAAIDTTGIFGSSYGALQLTFAVPVTSLTLTYSLFDIYIADLSDGALFASNNNSVDRISFAAFTPNDPAVDLTFGSAVGTLEFTDSPFTTVSLLFAYSPDTTFFTMDSISAEPVPEPATVLLLGAGLFFLAVYGKRRMNTSA